MAWNALPPLIVRAAAPLPRVVAARAVATAPTMATSDATFEHRPDQRRFVLTTDGHPSLIDYSVRNDKTLVLYHTEVPPALQGRGIAGELSRRTFDYLREQGLRAELTCSYLVAYAKKHPEVSDVVVGSGSTNKI